MSAKTYADFSGGWYGSLDPAKVPDNMFDARNMIVYRDGSIGPRPGLRAMNVPKVISGQVYAIDSRRNISVNSETLVLWIEYNGALSNPELYGVKDDQSGDVGTGYPWTINDVLPAVTSGFPINMYHKSNYRTFIHIPEEGGLWLFQQGQITALDTSSGSRVGTTSGVRVLRDEADTLNLFYSNASDPTTWGALDFIAIAEDPGASIVNISELNNYVVIVTDYGGWYMLSGVPGINDVLRQVYQDLVYPSPWGMKAFVTTSENELFGLSPENNFPVMFNGTKLDKLQYLSMNPEDPQASYANDFSIVHVSAVAIHSADTNAPCFILPSPENRMLTKANSVWGLHEFSVETDYAWGSNGGRIYGMTKTDVLYPDMSVQILTPGGSGLTSFTITYDGQTTGSLDDMATAAQVDTALEALSSIPAGEVAVTGADGGPWTITLSGSLAEGTVSLSTTPTGGTGVVDVSLPDGTEVVGDPSGAVMVVADFTLNRPAFTDDTHAQPGDLSDTPVDATLTLPEHWTESSDPVTVSEVVIDFVHYDTGASEDNQLVVTVTSLARGNESGTTNGTQTQTWTLPTASSTTVGVEDRVRFPFHDQGSGAGWRVEITGIRGVKIREVVVNDSEDNHSWRSA